MRILVTGANGFIGRNIISFLNSNNEFNIVGVDITDKYIGEQAIEYYCLDIANNADIEKVITDNEGYDIIIHTAASLDMNDSSNSNIIINGVGTNNIIQLAYKVSCKKIIYFSSIPVIGMPKEIPITEEHVLNPLTNYHATKLFGERLLNLPSNRSLRAVVLRIPSPIGRGMNPRTILPVLIESCKKNKDIILQGRGKRIQNYIDVRDICEAVLNCINRPQVQGIYNIANKTSYSNEELANICKEVTGSDSKVIFHGKDLQENYNWTISIEKAKKELGYLDNYDIRDSIKNML